MALFSRIKDSVSRGMSRLAAEPEQMGRDDLSAAIAAQEKKLESLKQAYDAVVERENSPEHTAMERQAQGQPSTMRQEIAKRMPDFSGASGKLKEKAQNLKQRMTETKLSIMKRIAAAVSATQGKTQREVVGGLDQEREAELQQIIVALDRNNYRVAVHNGITATDALYNKNPEPDVKEAIRKLPFAAKRALGLDAFNENQTHSQEILERNMSNMTGHPMADTIMVASTSGMISNKGLPPSMADKDAYVERVKQWTESTMGVETENGLMLEPKTRMDLERMNLASYMTMAASVDLSPEQQEAFAESEKAVQNMDPLVRKALVDEMHGFTAPIIGDATYSNDQPSAETSYAARVRDNDFVQDPYVLTKEDFVNYYTDNVRKGTPEEKMAVTDSVNSLSRGELAFAPFGMPTKEQYEAMRANPRLQAKNSTQLAQMIGASQRDFQSRAETATRCFTIGNNFGGPFYNRKQFGESIERARRLSNLTVASPLGYYPSNLAVAGPLGYRHGSEHKGAQTPERGPVQWVDTPENAAELADSKTTPQYEDGANKQLENDMRELREASRDVTPSDRHAAPAAAAPRRSVTMAVLPDDKTPSHDNDMSPDVERVINQAMADDTPERDDDKDLDIPDFLR